MIIKKTQLILVCYLRKRVIERKYKGDVKASPLYFLKIRSKNEKMKELKNEGISKRKEIFIYM